MNLRVQPSVNSALEPVFAESLATRDGAALRDEFLSHDEFIVLPDFLPSACLQTLLAALPGLAPQVHRNYIPHHKKGGSVSRFALDAAAPQFAELYHLPALLTLLRALTEQALQICPAEDPHAYALYYYTEPGDHIGYHYDTSYYAGARYTVLLGLLEDSRCRFEYQLYTKDPARTTEIASLQLAPGMLVLFNGDKLYHRVTPLGHQEQRIALTLEYVTSSQMHPARRFVSNMKDSIAYFGFKQVFSRRRI